MKSHHGRYQKLKLIQTEKRNRKRKNRDELYALSYLYCNGFYHVTVYPVYGYGDYFYSLVTCALQIMVWRLDDNERLKIIIYSFILL